MGTDAIHTSYLVPFGIFRSYLLSMVISKKHKMRPFGIQGGFTPRKIESNVMQNSDTPLKTNKYLPWDVQWFVQMKFIKFLVKNGPFFGTCYTSSHNHGSQKWVPPIGYLPFKCTVAIFHWTMIMGERVIFIHFPGGGGVHYHMVPPYGGFLKWWYPQIIHFNRVFHYKPSILGCFPIFGNTHMIPPYTTYLSTPA